MIYDHVELELLASMSTPTKLTKKQKKGLAFREKKTRKRKGDDDLLAEDNAVPVMEDQDALDEDADTDGKATIHKTRSTAEIGDDGRKRKATGEKTTEIQGQQKKRKRTASTLDAEDIRQTAKRKRNMDDGVEGGEKGSTKPTQRFILFVGMLPTYDRFL